MDFHVWRGSQLIAACCIANNLFFLFMYPGLEQGATFVISLLFAPFLFRRAGFKDPPLLIKLLQVVDQYEFVYRYVWTAAGKQSELDQRDLLRICEAGQ